MLERFGELLIILRESQEPRMTQEKLLEEVTLLGFRNKNGLPFSRSFIANIETNRTKPSPELLRGFERVFKLPEGSLLRFHILHVIGNWCEKNGTTIRHALDLAESGQRVFPLLRKKSDRKRISAVLQLIKEVPGGE